MKYRFGFLRDDLSFQPFPESSERDRELGLFHSWYEFDGPIRTIEEELDAAILSTPKDSVLMDSGSILDSAVIGRFRQHRSDVRTCTVQLNESTEGVREWVQKNKYRYFLTDHRQAHILYRADRLLREGNSVAFIGALPNLKDLNWQLTGRTPDTVIASDEPLWAVVDYCKNASVFLMGQDYPRLTPNLMFSGNLFLAYLREFDFLKNGRLLRALGLRELIEGELLGRRLAPSGFLGQEKIFPPCIDLPVIARASDVSRFYSPLAPYYDRIAAC